MSICLTLFLLFSYYNVYGSSLAQNMDEQIRKLPSYINEQPAGKGQESTIGGLWTLYYR